tara:strand:- start:5244 stop:5417 length:174 start_codon:yes stop_codon:yes gene_type:complete
MKNNPYKQIAQITDQLHTLAENKQDNSWRVRRLNRKLKKNLNLISEQYTINKLTHDK